MKVCHIYISPGHNFFGHHAQPPGAHATVEVSEVECVAGRGLVGDRFFNFQDDYRGQVTFFSQEVFNDLCARLQLTDRSPGAARRNIVLSGTDLNALIGEDFEIQGIRFRGVSECTPCYWMDHAFAPGAEKLLLNLGGLRARILSGGILKVNA